MCVWRKMVLLRFFLGSFGPKWKCLSIKYVKCSELFLFWNEATTHYFYRFLGFWIWGRKKWCKSLKPQVCSILFHMVEIGLKFYKSIVFSISCENFSRKIFLLYSPLMNCGYSKILGFPFFLSNPIFFSKWKVIIHYILIYSLSITSSDKIQLLVAPHEKFQLGRMKGIKKIPVHPRFFIFLCKYIFFLLNK